MSSNEQFIDKMTNCPIIQLVLHFYIALASYIGVEMGKDWGINGEFPIYSVIHYIWLVEDNR